MKLTKILIAFSVVAGLTYSCNREESNNLTLDQENLQTEANADFVSESDIDLATDFATNFENTSSLRTTTGGQQGAHPDYPCAKVTVSSTNGTFPKTITVDFGTGCTDKRGVNRKGIITISITNPIFLPGASITISHQDFYVCK